MKTRRKNGVLLAIAILVVAFCMNASRAFTQTAPQVLKQRMVRPKPAKTVLNSRLRSDVVVVKFREGTGVRERLGQLEADLTNLSSDEEQLLQRANLSRQRLFQDLAAVNAAVPPNSKRYIRRLFTQPEQELQTEKRDGERRIGEELTDLNLYFHILIEGANPRETEALIDALNALDSVEVAYAQPIPEPAQIDTPPTTPNLIPDQGYLRPAAGGASGTNGIDAEYARFFPGARGDDVRIIDIEYGWNLTHEDMPSVFYQAGPNLGSWEYRQHGTAVLGVLAAGDNGYGLTGIVPRSVIGVSSGVNRTCVVPGLCWLTDNLADSINRSTAQLRFGDIVIIEEHAEGPDSGLSTACDSDQFEYVPMEYWDANFDAIKNATAKGVIVVEAAGNGEMDLDSPIYSGKFNRAQRDSGAIMVGAGSSSSRSPLCFTNFGSRVDLQGWGNSVATLGYGGSVKTPDPALRINGLDDNQYYTRSFSGTSSASPIVAGAAAAIQGFRKAEGLGAFSPERMRDFLIQTGTPQAADARHIGSLPNLKMAIDAHAPKRTLKVTFLNVKVVDNLFAGPQQLAFTFYANNQAARYPSAGTTAFAQGVPVTLPSTLNLTTQEILDGGLTVYVATDLQSVITYHPKTHAVTSVQRRPVHMLRSFPTGTSFSSNPIAVVGSRTFTDRSTESSGYFEITYRVEQVLVATQNAVATAAEKR